MCTLARRLHTRAFEGGWRRLGLRIALLWRLVWGASLLGSACFAGGAQAPAEALTTRRQIEATAAAARARQELVLADFRARAERELRAATAEWLAGRASAAGLVVVDGARGARVALGRLARDSGRAFGEQTLFEVGSVSKVFAGLLLASAVHRHEVELAERLEHHLSDGLALPEGDARGATFLDAATHALDYPMMPSNWTRTDRATGRSTYTQAMFAQFLATHVPVERPGAGYHYSNVNAALLAHALSQRLKTPYSQLLRRRIFEPLSMSASGFADVAPPSDDVLAGDDDEGHPVPARIDVSPIAPCCVVRSNLVDMQKFMRAAISSNSALAPAFELQAQPRHRFDASGEQWMGLGIEWSGRERVLHKNGLVAGSTCSMILSPATRQALFLIVNSEAVASDIDVLAFQLAYKLLGIIPGDESEHARLLAAELPRDAVRHQVEFEQPVRLEGWTAPRRVEPGQRVPIALYFRLLGTLDRDYRIFVHAEDPKGKIRRETANHYPGTLDSTLRWKPGELVRDSFELRIPADAPAGQLQLWFGFYAGTARMQPKLSGHPDRRIPGPRLTVARRRLRTEVHR